MRSRSHDVPTLLRRLLTASLGLLGGLFLAVADAAEISEDNASLISVYKQRSFSPTSGETFVVPIAVEEKGLGQVDAVTLEIYTEDGDLVRSVDISKSELLKHKEGEPLSVQWDGLDEEGLVVPNEAYFPKLSVAFKDGGLVEEDVASSAWGEEVYEFQKKIRNGIIEYELPENVRLLIRAGIKNGPMLRTIVDWSPRAEGFHAERWNGKDSNGLRQIEILPDIAYLIIGYRLPEKAIFTTGNELYDYKEYRKKKAWPVQKKSFGEKELERGGRAIRPEFYLPLSQLFSPALITSNVAVGETAPISTFARFDEIISSVDIAKEDEFYLDQSRYEISFFVDYQFIAEEEQGYVPFRWRWSPGRYGIEPGEHILTVNISSYNGQVTVKNLLFNLSE